MPDLNEYYKKQLIDRYVKGEATENELMAFFGLLNTAELDSFIEEHMDAEIRSMREKEQTVKPRKSVWKYMAAATVLLCLGSVSYYVFHKAPVKHYVAQNQIQDIGPGSDKAVLTLADGKKITLTGAKNGKLADQGSVTIDKTKDGQLVYRPGSTSNAQAITYNIVETPRGGQYHLTLADGTQVWLNAASSLKYPAAFSGHERKVELTGEAYFEVAHNKEKPFRVISNGQEVEVLGTHFNINAYSDENAVKTTLVEGSVKISSGDINKMLKPDEQAQLENGNILITNVDVNAVVAWKNGLFYFDHATLQSAMRQIARWYDVDVVYEGAIPKTVINGEAYRNMKASQVFELLSYLNVKFRIEGKKIIVTNK
jgi:transmembrane sensor